LVATAMPTVCDWLLPVLTAICAAAPALAEAVNVTTEANGAETVAVTVLLLVPAAVPRIQELRLAMPLAFVSTVAPLGDEIDPLPVATAKVTLTPDTGLVPSVTSTDGAVPVAVLTVAVRLSPAVLVSVVAVAGVPVAVKVIGLPERPVTAAVSVFVPDVAPMTQEPIVATPEVFVALVPPLVGTVVEPPPDATVQVTETLLTGLLNASRTSTAGGVVTAKPTVRDWLLPALTAICVAAPAVAEAVKVTTEANGAETVAVTVLLLVPAALPSTHELRLAMPLAFVTTVAPLGDEIEPLPVATAKVTLTPATGFVPSVTSTDGAVATAVATVAVWLSPAGTFASAVAAAAVAVAVKVRTVPVSGPVVTVAVSVLLPEAAGMVHDVNDARPFTSVDVLTVVGAGVPLMEPLPAVTVKLIPML
jgi:hypothetical protein